LQRSKDDLASLAADEVQESIKFSSREKLAFVKASRGGARACARTRLFFHPRDEPGEGFLDAFFEAWFVREAIPKALKTFEDQVEEGSALALDRDQAAKRAIRPATA
jgi:hypothetical protein